MKILIASDLHGSVAAFQKVLKNEPDSEMVLLLGDYLYHGPRNPLPEDYNPRAMTDLINSLSNAVLVKGNVDAPIDEELIKWPMSPLVHLVFHDGGKNKNDVHILAHHGHNADPSKLYKTQMVVSGHTHIKVLEYDAKEGIFRFNPGSPSLPKDGIPSYGVILSDFKAQLKSLDGQVIKEIQIS